MLIRIVLFLLLVVSIISCKAEKQNQHLINQEVVKDYANLFTNPQKDSLSEIIINYEKVSTNQICVYTLNTIPNKVNAVVYATKIANQLGVGQAEKQNGLLLLIAKNDKKIAFATGYGTEKILTDSVCKTLIEYTLKPSFKKELYFEGVLNVLDSVKLKWID